MSYRQRHQRHQRHQRSHSHFALLVAACLILPPQVAFAAAGGGVDGGGGGGRMAPSQDEDGSSLSKIFREGVAFLTDGECKRAEKKFRDVLKKVPRNSEANYLRGIALQCQQNFKSSVRYFKRAKRDDAEFYQAYGALGISYLALGSPERALDALKELTTFKEICEQGNLRCPPELLKAHKKLATAIERAEGGLETPPEDVQHGLLFDGDADPQMSYLAAVSLINAVQFDEAIDQLRELAARLGPHPDVLNHLGYAHRRLGRFAEAERYYKEALAIEPMHRGANEYLGEMWVELGRTEAARERLAVLDEACPFGCAEYEDLKRIIESRLVATN